MADTLKKTDNTQLSWKYYFMSVAQIIDVFRVIPRLMVTGYGYMVWQTVTWFQSIPEPTSQHTFLISTIVGGAAAVFGLYVNSGSKWDDAKSADPHLYIQTGADGSSFGAPQPNNQGYQPQYQPQYQQQPQYRQPQQRVELEMPTRPKRGASPGIDETPPDDFYEED